VPSRTDLERIQRFPDQFVARIVGAFRTLLQEKHLYQSISVQTEDIPYAGEDRPDIAEHIQTVRLQFQGPWFLHDPETRRPGDNAFYFKPPDVKLYCTPCDRIEAFNLVFADDFLGRGGARFPQAQAFVLSYQCQSCKGVPEVFLVRRDGPRLTLSGRAPIEHVEVPADVPKIVKRFYSGAIVAHQSGQTLAGLFLLRTLIEQFARSATASKAQNADQVMDEYMTTLPSDFRGRFPSMRELYGELSADLHTAAGSPELFGKATIQIAEHFETRRVFKLSDLPPAATTELGSV